MTNLCTCIGDECDRPLCLMPTPSGNFRIHCDECGLPISALAAAARQGGDVERAPGEAPQSGPKGNAQNSSHPIKTKRRKG